MIRWLALITVLVVTSFGVTAPLYAKSVDTQKALGTFGQWRAFEFKESGQPVCTMTLTFSVPPKGHVRQRTGYVMITHRPADNSRDVVSFTPGYVFKPESVLQMRFKNKTVDLFTTHDTAWARDAVTDHRLAALLRSSAAVVAIGTPVMAKKTGKNVPVVDHLSLVGAAKAYAAIGKACGVEIQDQPVSKKQAKTKKAQKSKP